MTEKATEYVTKKNDIEKWESRSIAEVPAATEMTPAALLSIAVKQGADLEKMEKLMELQERWEANQAKKSYIKAMTAFKINPPEILKKVKVEYLKTKYSHASLDHVTDEINKSLSTHGLFASWSQTQAEGNITVTCKITHEDGYSEETSLTAGADMSGSKNAIQGLGSTITYLQRYTILALTGLAAKGMDNDGKGAETEYVSDKQLSSIIDMINAKNIDDSLFLKHMGVESTDKIPASDFNRAMDVLKKAKGKK
jgi:hypothetical protein